MFNRGIWGESATVHLQFREFGKPWLEFWASKCKKRFAVRCAALGHCGCTCMGIACTQSAAPLTCCSGAGTGEALLKAIDVELAGEAGPAAEADPGGAAGAGDDRPTTAFAAERRRTGARGGRLQRRPGTRPHLRPGFWRGKARAGGFNASDYQLTRRACS